MKKLYIFAFMSMMLTFSLPSHAIKRGELIKYASSLKGLKKAELKKAISQCCKPQSTLSYGSGLNKTWGGFYLSDRNEETNECINRYSENVFEFGNQGESISGMNIEHSFPKSWWGGSDSPQQNKDLFNLYPSDQSANSSKSNYPMGKVTKPTKAAYETVGLGPAGEHGNITMWEPNDTWKGDFCRSYFYMVSVYDNSLWVTDPAKCGPSSQCLENNDWPTFQEWAYKTYLDWVRADKVLKIEVKRNNAIYEIQKNRNLFIDYPNLVEYVWGDSIDVEFDPYTSVTTADNDNRYFEENEVGGEDIDDSGNTGGESGGDNGDNTEGGETGGETTTNPTDIEHGIFFAETFDKFDGTGGNDGKWNGSISAASQNIEDKTDNVGWTFSKGYIADKCAKFGTGSAKGIATTPAINCHDEECLYLSFDAAAWDGTSEATNIKVSATNCTLSDSIVSITKAEWNNYSLAITDITGPVKITFSAASKSNNRFFLDNIYVKNTKDTEEGGDEGGNTEGGEGGDNGDNTEGGETGGEDYNNPSDIEHGIFFAETFDKFGGKGGNDAAWNGTIANVDIKSDSITDNRGWAFTAGYIADKCAKFGTGSAQGIATTPAINCLDEECLYLSFDAAAWDGTSEATNIKVSATNCTLSDSIVSITKAEWKNYSLTITDITGPVKITFSAASKSNNRFFLDNIYVKNTKDTEEGGDEGGNTEGGEGGDNGDNTEGGETGGEDYNNPSDIEHGIFFAETFDKFVGKGGNDAAWNGSIANVDIKSDSITDNRGWAFTAGYIADKCAKFGTGSAKGIATTPAINCLDEECLYLSFDAAAWNGTSEATNIKVSATNCTLSDSIISITKAEWNNYSLTITDITGPVKITFSAATQKNNRFFLDNIYVKNTKDTEEGGEEGGDEGDGEEDEVKDIYFAETFDKFIEGTGGRDSLWSGSIATKYDNIETMTDNADWTLKKCFIGNECLKVSSSKNKGTAETPNISGIKEDSAYLLFEAAAWNSKDEITEIRVSATNCTLSDSIISITKAEWKNYMLTITDITGPIKIQFSASEETNNRFFLDNVYVKNINSIEIKKGDVNVDGKVDCYDVETLANILAGKTEPTSNADINDDEKVSIADLFELIKIVNQDEEEANE